MIEILIVIAALITVLLAAIIWKVVLGQPFIHGYTRYQKAEAKKKILKYLDTNNGHMCPREVAERLQIDYDLCIRVLIKLYREGEIRIMYK